MNQEFFVKDDIIEVKFMLLSFLKSWTLTTLMSKRIVKEKLEIIIVFEPNSWSQTNLFFRKSVKI
jgi:hypothetical protein